VARKRLLAVSSSGNSRAGSRRTSLTFCRLRWILGVEGADRVDLVVEQLDAVRLGLPIGKMSSRAPRTAKSPGSSTCGTLR
jgi:hypothetical protein